MLRIHPSRLTRLTRWRRVAFALSALPAMAGHAANAAPNQPPSATSAAVVVDEDSVARGVIEATDPEGGPLRFTLHKAARLGTAVVDDSGAWSYTPKRDATGDDAFVVAVKDAAGATARATIAITITPVNDAPTITVSALQTQEDTLARITLKANDIDGDPLRWRIAKAASKGTATIDATTGAMNYAPGLNENGDDAFDVEVSDGTLTATVTVPVTITPVNDAPVAAAGSITVDEDGGVDGAIVASDVDGDTLGYVLKTSPKRGTVTVNATTGAFRFVPTRDENGADSFVVEVKDPGGKSATATVAITITPVNDAPTLTVENLGTTEDTPTGGRGSARDIDGDTLTWRVQTPPGHGDVGIDADSGRYTYTPAENTHGDDTFVLAVSDGTTSSSAAVSVVVRPVPDPPRAAAQQLTTPEDTTLHDRLDGSDPDGDPITFTVVRTATVGRFTLDDAHTGAFTYTPAPDHHGQDSVAWTVSDGGRPVPAELGITITPENDAPTIAGLALSTDEDVPVAGRFVGVDVDNDPLRFDCVVPAGATVIQGKGGDFIYTPPPDANGSMQFTVTAFDGTARSAPATVTIAVAAKNDAPRQHNGSVTTMEDVAVNGVVHADDVDGDTLSYRIVQQPLNGRVVLHDDHAGTFTYAPNRDVFGTDSFRFEASDGKAVSPPGTITITMTPVDDAPRGTPQRLRVSLSGSFFGELVGYDPEGAPIRFAIASPATSGRVRLIDATRGTFSYQAGSSRRGRDRFTFTVSDATLTSEPVEVVIDVE